MQGADDLRRILRRIDGRGYKAYKDIEGIYNFGEYTLFSLTSPSRTVDFQ